jgi:hypothetical protein
LGVYAAIGAVNGKVTQVFCHSKTAWKDQRIKLIQVQFIQTLNIATGDARGFHQYIATLSLGRFAAKMIDHMHLLHVWGKAARSCSKAIDGQKGKHGFPDFGAVQKTTAS